AQTVYSPGVRTLGRFQLVGIPPAPRGVPQIEVTFDIDANGIVHVSAKDLGTGKEQAMTITGGTALPKEEMERMMREAEQFAEEDRSRRELAEARNLADNLVYQSEKSLKEYGDKLSTSDRASIETSIEDLKEALKTDDLARIKAATESLTQSSHKLAQQVYAQSQAASAGGAGGAAAGGGDEEVVDAEIVEEG
ncbi:MAG: Hsp70 family protein, partial [Actinomycetota bacterium]